MTKPAPSGGLFHSPPALGSASPPETPMAKPSKKKAAKPSRAQKDGSGGFSRLRRLVITLTTLAAGAYASLAAFAWFGSDALIFPAPRPSYPSTFPDLLRIPVPGGGQIAALWLPKAGATRTILYFHGNAADLGLTRHRLELIREFTGCSLLAIDYPGYGVSTGTPTENSVLHAADAAYDHLRRIRAVPAENIVLWGRSLGSGPAVYLASRHHARALILDAPFTSTFRTVIPRKVLPFDKFDNLTLMPRVQTPVLIAHGNRDTVVPFSHGSELAKAAIHAPAVKFLPLPDVGHNDLPGPHGEAYRSEILRFIQGETGE